MPKVLDMEMISNAEVLNFIKSKKQEYKQQDSETAKKDRKALQRPSNVVRSLDQHEEHLASEHYPYATNPSVYGNAGLIKGLTGSKNSNNKATNGDKSDVTAEQKFNQFFAERILLPAAKKRIASRKTRLGRALSSDEKDAIINEIDTQRSLSDTERLMVLNHAPTCLEMLQPMIESLDERYNEEEQGLIVEAIQQAFRPDHSQVAANGTVDQEMDG